MERKAFSELAKSSSEDSMPSTALIEAKTWADILHDAEFKGRKDTDGAARYRLANRIGVKESYLFRLQYRAEEMKDVAGEVYRRLKIAIEAHRNARIEEHRNEHNELRQRLAELDRELAPLVARTAGDSLPHQSP